MLQFLRYLVRGFKWHLLGIVTVGILSIATSLIFIYLSKEIIDIATGVTSGNWIIYAILLASSLGVQALLRLATISQTNYTAVTMGNTIRRKIFGHLLYTRWQNLRHLHSGDMLTRIVRDTDDVVTLLTTSLPSAALSGLQLVASLAMMYFYSPMLALMLGLGMPLLLISGRAFYRRMVRFSQEIKAMESKINTHIQEVLSNQTVVRTFERQESEINELDLLQTQLYRSVRRRVWLTMYGNLMSNTAFSGGYFIAFLWGAYGLMRGSIWFGTMTAFLQLVTRIQRPMSDLLSLVPSMIAAKASIDRLVHVLAYPTEVLDERTLLTEMVSLDIKSVSFKYEDGGPLVFEHFNLNTKPGEMIALMGPTGAGKTTLLRLLLGLVRPSKGSIVLRSGGEITHVSESTRGNFVYVPQGNTLLSGTIRENLLVGDATADERKLRHVLMIAEAEFVYGLPQGLDTMLGERGAGLSEGQAQRIAIARSLLRPGRILLLDEATSALDSETARAFIHNLKQHNEGRIILLITHDESIAHYCDKLIRL